MTPCERPSHFLLASVAVISLVLYVAFPVSPNYNVIFFKAEKINCLCRMKSTTLARMSSFPTSIAKLETYRRQLKDRSHREIVTRTLDLICISDPSNCRYSNTLFVTLNNRIYFRDHTSPVSSGDGASLERAPHPAVAASPFAQMRPSWSSTMSHTSISLHEFVRKVDTEKRDNHRNVVIIHSDPRCVYHPGYSNLLDDMRSPRY
jgi:hypothetical protein